MASTVYLPESHDGTLYKPSDDDVAFLAPLCSRSRATGSNPSDFTITKASTCPNSGTINPLATCLITVTFTPTATGSRSATVTVTDNTSKGTQTISLSGTGKAAIPTATLLPASLNFGSVTQGTTSSTQTSILTDTSITVALNITSITLSGADPGDFQITKASTCPNSGTINPLGTCLITVTFTPTETGSRSATLTVYDNVAHGQQTIKLSGTGKAAIPTATLLPASLKFGAVTPGTTQSRPDFHSYRHQHHSRTEHYEHHAERLEPWRFPDHFRQHLPQFRRRQSPGDVPNLRDLHPYRHWIPFGHTYRQRQHE